MATKPTTIGQKNCEKKSRKNVVSNDINFVKIYSESAISSCLIQSSYLTVSGAIRQAYSQPSILWPPTPDDLDVSHAELLPDELTQFIGILLKSILKNTLTQTTKQRD